MPKVKEKNIISEINSRTQKLLSILKELSYNQNILEDSNSKNSYYTKLDSIYRKLSDGTEYRHPYSEIFGVLTEIDSENEASIDILAQNIGIIYQFSRDKQNKELGICIEKLYDHVSLDVARINYVKAIDSRIGINAQKIEDKLTTLDEMAQKLTTDVEQFDTKIKEYVDKVDNSQKEYVSILGIFAAVVLAFTGGTIFSSSVLENMHLSSIYRSLIVVMVLGIILIDVLFLLMDFIKVINKNITASKIPVIVMNIILIIGIALVCWAYKVQWFSNPI